MLQIRTTPVSNDVVLEFSGEFDTLGAEELAAVAAAQTAGARLVIDLSRARPIQDKALGRLVDALPQARKHTVRGAGPHHRRLLECLGAVVEEEELREKG